MNCEAQLETQSQQNNKSLKSQLSRPQYCIYIPHDQEMTLTNAKTHTQRTCKDHMISQSLKHKPQILCMLLSTTRIHKNVINEHNNKIVQIGSKHTVHQIHECNWGISHPKNQHQKHIMTIMGPKSCLQDILSPNPLLMITEPQINFRKHGYTLKMVKQIINTRHRVMILHCHLNKLPIIDTHTYVAMFLLHK